MTSRERKDIVDAPLGKEPLRGRVESIRASVQRMDADTVGRQLPNLTDAIAREAQESGSQATLVIGIAFSKNDTLLDYRLDKVVADGDTEPRQLETLKAPVSTDLLYLTFPYPPDPYVDEEAIRGALLSALERSMFELEPQADADSAEDGTSGERGPWYNLRKHLGRFGN